MQTASEDQFNGRERGRLRRGRENGYLNAGCRASQRLREAYSFWCWRMRIPVVWFERQSPRSKYGRVHLDLFTTPHELTQAGETALRTLAYRLELTGAVAISRHDVVWERVPMGRVEELAKSAFRCVTRAGNYAVGERKPAVAAGPAGNKVIAWRISA